MHGRARLDNLEGVLIEGQLPLQVLDGEVERVDRDGAVGVVVQKGKDTPRHLLVRGPLPAEPLRALPGRQPQHHLERVLRMARVECLDVVEGIAVEVQLVVRSAHRVRVIQVLKHAVVRV